jgi:hypothetical protein
VPENENSESPNESNLGPFAPLIGKKAQGCWLGYAAAKVLEQFPRMMGSRLVKADVRPPGGDTTFIFENDLTLNCFPARSQEGVSWEICTEDGNQLRLGPGARVTYRTGLR